MLKKTSLNSCHLDVGGKMVDFGGWEMPIHYGSQLNEHQWVRESAGMFDVSHMTVIDILGAGAKPFLRKLLANDVDRLKGQGQALYSAMLNPEGGVIDDLIVYRRAEGYRLVVNCATREKDLTWIKACADAFEVAITAPDALSILAVQGPKALSILQSVLDPAQARCLSQLAVFESGFAGDWFIARTGYTGEQGAEIILPNAAAPAFWQALLTKGVHPIGLGARDTLRLEAGMNLYGNDMDDAVSPLACNMAWTVVHNDRDFIGESAVQATRAARAHPQLIGVILIGRGVLRAHYPVLSGATCVGELTSGAFSPTLQRGIGFARISASDQPLFVEIRGKRLPLETVSLPFVRHGKPVYKAVS
ncbi:MAG: glycine cleavage system aminomethyltransferase GcvT [Pseudomonadales bacterium]|jgi:aminomethyltransferase|tara:strand:+ start:1890 stop:2975 length:1086 start_codon:yes stop_codon:yes gene_type:complete